MLYVLTPLGRQWSLEGSIVRDAVCGPSPRYHSAMSSASPMKDERHAGDLRLTRYFRRAAVGFGLAYSTEDDYESRALSFDVRMSSDDNNTSIVFGAGYSDDTIKPNDTGGGSVTSDEKKKVNDFIVGLTQVVTPREIVQANLTHSRGRGFFSDPYEFLDNRPRERNQTALLGRWNHHFDATGATLRSIYRYYSDTFEVKAHTFGFEWVQPMRALTVTASLRYHTQSSADFYVDPIPGSAFPPVVSLRPPYYSADHRLWAFGAVTAGLKIAYAIGKDWAIDAKFDYYEQRGDWRLGGQGQPRTRSVQGAVLSARRLSPVLIRRILLLRALAYALAGTAARADRTLGRPRVCPDARLPIGAAFCTLAVQDIDPHRPMTSAYFGFDFRARADQPANADTAAPAAGAVVRLDRDGRIDEATVEAAAQLGYAPNDLVGRSLVQLAATGWEIAARSVTARIQVGLRDVGELLLAGRSGRRTLLRMAARPADDTQAGRHIVAWTEVPRPSPPPWRRANRTPSCSGSPPACSARTRPTVRAHRPSCTTGWRRS